jgi:putative copper resistance protein D
MGNGIKSRTLSTKLPDLLIEPHIVEHTPGDFYNWITYGMKNTDMPGYADKMSEDDRWDLVNYIHALSRGYQARILSPEIIVEKVFAKPPLFSFNKHDGSQGALQEFRERKTILLILFSWPQSQERLAQLRQAYDHLQQQNIEILAVPTQELGIDELEQASAALPFSVVTQGAPEIVDSYMLWRRTLNHPDIIGRGKNPEHIEFLFDKNGYLRARWIPSRDQSGWSDVDVLIRQVSQLNREQTQFPFPEDHIR